MIAVTYLLGLSGKIPEEQNRFSDTDGFVHNNFVENARKLLILPQLLL